MKRVFGVAFLFLLLIPAVCAVELDMKSGFGQYETLTARVSGNFVSPLLGSNFFLYREHVRVPLEFHVKYIEGYYYAYAQLSDKQPGNYTLSLENIEYMSRNEILKDKIIQNFSITENISGFSVEPGFIVTDTDFSIRVQN